MLEILNKIIWAIATVLIVTASIYFTFRLKFKQFHFKQIFSSVFRRDNESVMNSFSILMLTLAGRIGIGSIAGVALCIYIGGVGSLFWLWIISFFSAILSYIEAYLGNKYHEKDGPVYKGGPSYYIKNGLHYKKLGGIYAILVIVSYIGGFLSIQTNTITKSLNELIAISPVLLGLIIVVFTAPIILGGIEKISQTTNRVVPIMGIFYLLLAGYIISKNIILIPKILKLILTSAFHLKPFFSGFLTSLIVGVQRGIFSNEAGLGTSSISSSITNSDHEKQGYIQILGVYITSLLICSATAFIILTSDYHNLTFVDLNGIEIASYAFHYHMGYLGNIFLFLSILFFSFSTILTGYYYGESSLKYFFEKPPKITLFILKLCTLVILFLGCVVASDYLWKLVDIFVAFLAIINIYAIYRLKKDLK